MTYLISSILYIWIAFFGGAEKIQNTILGYF